MNLRAIGISLVALLTVSGCGNDGQSVGNGPGDADGAGGRADPPTAPANDSSSNAATTDPVGAHTEPDGSTEDTGQEPGATSTGTPPPQE